MSHKSIRFRLTVWYSLALGAGLVLFGLAIWFSMRFSLTRDLDTTLAVQARSVGVFIEVELAKPNIDLVEELGEYCQGLPKGSYVRVLDAKNSVIFASNARFPWPVHGGSARKLQTIRWREADYRLLTTVVPARGQRWEVSIGGSLEHIQELLDLLRLLLIMFIPAVVVAAVIGGALLSRRALKPVDEITDLARSIGISNLSERLIVPKTGDELQRLSEAWNSMLSRLEAAVRRLSRFTADAAHELRTPLGVIRMTAEIAARKTRPAESYRQALEQITVESERMTSLLDDLLLLARCDSEPVEMPKARLDLKALVDGSCRGIMPLAESCAVQLIPELQDRPCWVLGNESALRRLVFVLLDNAIKYSDAGGRVFVRLRRERDGFWFEVADEGRGIAQADLPYLFERFYRSQENGRNSPDGYGLGLALAAGIAQRHDAHIDVETVPGEGSTFRVLFQPIRDYMQTDLKENPHPEGAGIAGK